MITQSDLARAAAVARAVDAVGRIHIRSGQGLARDWPRNLLANPRAVLHIDGRDIAVQARRVTDRAELRGRLGALEQKYRWQLPNSQPGEALTPPEQATFELMPAEH